MNIKSILSFAVAALFSVALATAQTQTGQTGTTQPTQSSPNYTTVNPTSGMTQVNSSALPDPLRSTLQGNQQYKGWEGGQWYFNSTTNQYLVQMPGANTALSTNPSTTTGTQPNPLGSTNPTQGSTSITNPTTSPTNPTSTTPVTGMQLPTSQPSPAVTTPTWYRFDQSGKLIPQPRDN